MFHGFNIFINDVKVYPYYFEGLNVKPGLLTKILFKKNILTKEPYPYSDCQDINTFESELVNEFKRYGNICLVRSSDL